jgi:hypothetical protein
MNRIHKIGVEIEGFWNSRAYPDAAPGARGSDGSVQGPDDPSLTGCEYVSAPYENLLELTEWMRRVYPASTNQTCGMHTHFSFKNPMHYGYILDKQFNEFFLEEMTGWAKRANIRNKHFYARLEGKNHFCEKIWKPEKQMAATGKDMSVRYGQWNFCWAIRKTAECRMLPTFKDVNVSIAAITQLVRLIERYLNEYPVATAYTAKVVGDAESLPEHCLQILRS